MEYSEASYWVQSLIPRGMNLGLTRVKRLCALLGNPQDSLRVIHVGGTNGKGSTSAAIAAIVTRSGYKTGLFTSPYIVDIRESIQIDCSFISQCDFCNLVGIIKPHVDSMEQEGLYATEFEVLTAMAFLWFRMTNCDLAVVEVGLGGEDDATSIIEQPLISIIASISYDHTAVMGDTLSEIAEYECGIMKPNGVTIAYPDQTADALRVIKTKAAELHNRLIVPNMNDLRFSAHPLCGIITYHGHEMRSRLIGTLYMAKNASTALEAVSTLQLYGFIIPDAAISSALHDLVLPARMEVISNSPICILNGGGNPGCAEFLRDSIPLLFLDRPVIALCSLMADKQYQSYLDIAIPSFTKIIATQAPVPRSLQAKDLYTLIREYTDSVDLVEDCYEGFSYGLRSALLHGGVLVVCGSFYLCEPIRKYFFAEHPEISNLEGYLLCQGTAGHDDDRTP